MQRLIRYPNWSLFLFIKSAHVKQDGQMPTFMYH